MCTYIKNKCFVTDEKVYSDLMMKKNSSILFGVSISIFLSVMIIRTSFLAHTLMLDTGLNFRLVIFGCLSLLALKEYIVERHTVILFLHMLLLMFLCLIIKNVNTFTAAASVIFLYSSRNESFRFISKIALYVTTILLLVIIVMSLLGAIPNYQFEIDTTRPRFFLGFGYALYAPAYLFNITALVLYLKRDKIGFLTIFLELLANEWLYAKTNSRLSYGFTLLVILVSIIIKIPIFKKKKKRKYIFNPIKSLFSLGVIFSFVICTIISFAFIINYNDNSEFQVKLDSILTHRLENCNKSYNEYGIKIFGENISWVGNGVDSEGNKMEGDYFYVDNMYLQFSQHYGWLVFLLFLLITMYGGSCFIREKEWILIFILFLIALHAMLDDLVFHIWYNTFWLAFSPVVFKDRITCWTKEGMNYEQKTNLL